MDKSWKRIEDITILSEQVKVVDAIKNLKNLIGQRALQQHQSPRTQHVAKHLSQLHDKACCYPFGHIYCLINGQGIDNSVCNPTFTPTSLMEILENNRSVLYSFDISTKDEELDIASPYSQLILHKCPYKQYYTAVYVKRSMKPLSKILKNSISTVKSQ